MEFSTKTDHIVWSTDITLTEFLGLYGKKLPQIIKIKTGYHGDYLFDSINIDDILRVEKFSKQQRLVGQDFRGGPISIPVDYPLQLEILTPGESEPSPTLLKDLLKEHPLFREEHWPIKLKAHVVFPTTTTTPVEDDERVVTLDGIVERCLLTNSVLVDEFKPTVRIIPANLNDVRLLVAEGFNDPDMNWKDFTSILNQSATSVDYYSITGSSKIAEEFNKWMKAKKVTAQEDRIPAWKSVSSDLDAIKDKGIAKMKDLVHDIRKHVNIPGGVLKKKAEKGDELLKSQDGDREDYTKLHFTKPAKEESEKGDNDELVEKTSHRVPVLPSKAHRSSSMSEKRNYRRADYVNVDVLTTSAVPQVPLNKSTDPESVTMYSSSPALTDILEETKQERITGTYVNANMVDPKPIPSRTVVVGGVPCLPIKPPKPNKGFRTLPTRGKCTEHRLQQTRLSSPNEQDTSVKKIIGALECAGFGSAISSERAQDTTSPTETKEASPVRKTAPLKAPKPKLTKPSQIAVPKAPPPKTSTKPSVSVRPITAAQDNSHRNEHAHSEEMQTNLSNEHAHSGEMQTNLSDMDTNEIVNSLKVLKLDEATLNVFREKRLDGRFFSLISDERLREILQAETQLSVVDIEITITFIKHGWRPT